MSIKAQSEARLNELRTINFSQLSKSERISLKAELTAMRDKVDAAFQETQAKISQVNQAIQTLEKSNNQTLLVGRAPRLEQAHQERLTQLRAEKEIHESKLAPQTELKAQITRALKAVPSTSCCSTRVAVIATLATAVLAAGTGLAVKYYV
jgi:hypothetical protein